MHRAASVQRQRSSMAHPDDFEDVDISDDVPRARRASSAPRHQRSHRMDDDVDMDDAAAPIGRRASPPRRSGSAAVGDGTRRTESLAVWRESSQEGAAAEVEAESFESIVERQRSQQVSHPTCLPRVLHLMALQEHDLHQSIIDY